MWHVLHLIARPIEALLGLFCVLTAIVLYPDEEGKIQSKLEDWWLRIGYLKESALSWHTAFLTQVAKLETRFLDRVFGEKLFSLGAIAVSFACSITSLAVVGLLQRHEAPVGRPYDFFNFRQSLGLLCLGICEFGVFVSLTRRRILSNVTLILTLGLAVLGWMLIISNVPSLATVQSLAKFRVQSYFVYYSILSVLCVLGFVCDVVFIAITRKGLQKISETSRSSTIVVLVLMNVLLAALLVGPYFIDRLDLIPANRVHLGWSPLVALTNMFDAVLALLFALLALLLLIHRTLWPLLTRTFFRIQDIGTKGRRAILTTVGVALLAAGISGKVPELLQKLIEKLGG